MKRLIEEQMQKRQELLFSDFKTTTEESSSTRLFPSSTNALRSSSSSSETNPPTSRYDYLKLPPSGSRAPSSSFVRSSTADFTSSGISKPKQSNEYKSRPYGDNYGRISASHSDLTTVTPRTGSGQSYYYHHHHEVPSYEELQNKVAEILKRNLREGARSSSSQSADTTTIESTHPGSNDAVPPRFPSTVYGNSTRNDKIDAGIQANVSRYSILKDSATSFSNDEFTRPLSPPDRFATVTKTKNLSDIAGGIDVATIAQMLEGPIKAAVKKCVEEELRQANLSQRPASRHSQRHSPGIDSTIVQMNHEGNRRPASRISTRNPSPTPTEQLERVLDSERRMAGLAQLKAEEQANRVRRLQEVLEAEKQSRASSRQSKLFEDEDRENVVYGSTRSPSPTRQPSPLGVRQQSPIHKSVPPPVAWYVPANKPSSKEKKKEEKGERRGYSVRMDFPAPTKLDHNFITGRIQSMLDPVSPEKKTEDLTLEESLRLSNRNFILRSTERLRRLRLHAIERKMTVERKKAAAAIDLDRDDFFAQQSKRVHDVKQGKGARSPTGRRMWSKPNMQKCREGQQKKNYHPSDKAKKSDEVLFQELLNCETASVASTTSEMKRIRSDTSRRAMLLPEAIAKAEQERRALQAKQNRLRGEIFKQVSFFSSISIISIYIFLLFISS